MTQKATDDRPYSPSGCCADRRSRDNAAAKGRPTDGYRVCDASTCMQLPEGESCSTCAHERRCTTMFGAQSHNTHCQFFPRRFLKRKSDPEVERAVGRIMRDPASPPPTIVGVSTDFVVDTPVPAEPLVVLRSPQRPAGADDLTLAQIETRLREHGVFGLRAFAHGDGPVLVSGHWGAASRSDALVSVEAEGGTLAEALEALLRSANRLTNGT